MKHTLKTLASLTGLCLGLSFSANAQSTNWLTAGNTVTVTPTLGITTSTGSFPLNIKNASTTQPINFFTNGSQKVTILSNGNMGIGTGTVSPTSKLDVKGGNIALNQGKLLLLDNSDQTEALMSGHNTFAGTGSLGPVLYGSGGGTLGTRSITNVDYVALNWNNSGVKIPGTLSIGAAPVVSGYQLFVQQGILAEKVKVAVIGTGNWSDYVFDKEYKLKSITELETFINANKHLPGIPSAKEMVKDGLDVATMDAKLLGRIEELSLYIIELNKTTESLKKEVEVLKKK